MSQEVRRSYPIDSVMWMASILFASGLFISALQGFDSNSSETEVKPAISIVLKARIAEVLSGDKNYNDTTQQSGVTGMPEQQTFLEADGFIPFDKSDPDMINLLSPGRFVRVLRGNETVVAAPILHLIIDPSQRTKEYPEGQVIGVVVVDPRTNEQDSFILPEIQQVSLQTDQVAPIPPTPVVPRFNIPNNIKIA